MIPETLLATPSDLGGGEAPDFPHIGAPYENALLGREEYVDGRLVLRSLPTIVNFALTTFCNNAAPCLICDRHVRPPSADSETTREVIEHVRPLLRTALCVFLHCGGEPMFTRLFDEVIDSLEPPTRASFATNARLLTRQRTDRMLARDIMGSFVVSLDGSTAETHELMRPSSRFDQVVSNITYYTGRSRALGRASQVLLNMTVCEANLKDVPGLVDLAVQTGAVGVDYNHLNAGPTHRVMTRQGWEWSYGEQEHFSNPALHDELVMEAYRRAAAAGIHITFVGRPFIGPLRDSVEPAVVGALAGTAAKVLAVYPDDSLDGWTSAHHARPLPNVPPCLKPWREIVIQPNGDIRECYFHDQRRWTMANITRQPFDEIWNSEEMVEERRAFLRSGFSARCAASAPCMHRGRI
jgi:radical SAM protein with 4Fe4S-binding SPASM domain